MAGGDGRHGLLTQKCLGSATHAKELLIRLHVSDGKGEKVDAVRVGGEGTQVSCGRFARARPPAELEGGREEGAHEEFNAR